MRLIFICIAIALAAGAFFITQSFIHKPEEQSQLPVAEPRMVVKEVPTVNVFVARQDLPVGAIIERTMLDIQPWPQHLLLPDFVQAGDAAASLSIEKMVARTPFQKGEVVMRSKLANPKDPSFLAASLGKGMRAVTIASDAIAGVAGFVFPGDRVDVLITQDVSLGKEDNVGRPKVDKVTEVLLSNVRVLAVNQKSTAHGAEGPTVPTSISLEVSQVDAQRLRLGEASGARMSVALRSIKDRESAELARPTGTGDLSRITPPAYFPVLYDKATNYTSIAGTFEPGAPVPSVSGIQGHTPGSLSTTPGIAGTSQGQVGEALSGTMMSVANPLANVSKEGIDQSAMGGRSSITIIRGLSKSVEEVEEIEGQ